MADHNITKCHHCQVVIRQCRCIGPHGVDWSECDSCKRMIALGWTSPGAPAVNVDETRLAKLAAGDCVAGHVEAAWMAREILRRRAADLSDADREALRWARIHTINSMRPNDSGALKALAVLDRLIGDAP